MPATTRKTKSVAKSSKSVAKSSSSSSSDCRSWTDYVDLNSWREHAHWPEKCALARKMRSPPPVDATHWTSVIDRWDWKAVDLELAGRAAIKERQRVERAADDALALNLERMGLENEPNNRAVASLQEAALAAKPCGPRETATVTLNESSQTTDRSAMHTV